jgi:hypothetical protein
MPDTRHCELPSDAAGNRAAAMYTIVQTAKLNDVNPEADLRTTLAKIADGHSLSSVDERCHGIPQMLCPSRHFVACSTRHDLIERGPWGNMLLQSIGDTGERVYSAPDLARALDFVTHSQRQGRYQFFRG